MDSIRKPFQGVLNIIRFNWHYYLLSVIVVILLLTFRSVFNSSLRSVANVVVILIVCTTLISLIVSFYIYDLSDIYKLSWLNNLKQSGKETIVNINAGFDETSNLLKTKFRESELLVFDFYDPSKHTEISIQRARNAYPSFPGTQQVSTKSLPVENNSADKIFLIFSAHEIRSDTERIGFFEELNRISRSSGQIIVMEHLRDIANFLAYNLGFFHFHSRSIWLKTFHLSGLTVAKEIKITSFITVFILEKNGTAS